MWETLRTFTNRAGLVFNELKTAVLFAEDLNAITNNLDYLKAIVDDAVLPTGGTAGQVLTKIDGTAYNVAWSDPTGGGGGIPTAITVANEVTDTSCFMLFVTGATGDLSPKTSNYIKVNSAKSSFMVGNTTAGGLYAFSNGLSNDSSGDYSFTTGRGNTASASYAFSGGYGNTVSATYGSAFGRSHTVNSSYAFAIGYEGSTRGIKTFFVQGVEKTFTGIGSAQKGSLPLSLRTTTNSPAILTSDSNGASATNQLKLDNNQSIAFTGKIVVRESASTNSAMWKIEGLIIQDDNNASTTLVASTVTAISNVPAYTAPALSADTTNGALSITVTGNSATTMFWVATLDTCEAIQA